MQVNGVSSTYQTAASGNTQVATNNAANGLDATQFMQLLMAQLTHQDPLEPMDNAEMMSQFSQLNSLQELRDIHTAIKDVSASSQTTYLAALIGKTVKAYRPDGKILEAAVDGVVVDQGNPQIRIGSEVVDLKDVIEIKE